MLRLFRIFSTGSRRLLKILFALIFIVCGLGIRLTARARAGLLAKMSSAGLLIFIEALRDHPDALAQAMIEIMLAEVLEQQIAEGIAIVSGKRVSQQRTGHAHFDMTGMADDQNDNSGIPTLPSQLNDPVLIEVMLLPRIGRHTLAGARLLERHHANRQLEAILDVIDDGGRIRDGGWTEEITLVIDDRRRIGRVSRPRPRKKANCN